MKCTLCARNCGANRENGELGYCKSTSEMRICRADLHRWEEPIISGENGSGAIFFSGCSLGCVYCQNREISRSAVGDAVSEIELADIMLSLRDRGAHNINFVTPTHFAPSIITSVKIARESGLDIPIIYNTGAFDTPSTIKALADTVDVYLPDYKYYLSKTASRLSSAPKYPEVAFSAISEMVSQRPVPVLENGLIKRGVLVRFLLLPGHLAETKLAVSKVFREFKNNVYYSLMGQYTPPADMTPPLNRRVTRGEYDELVNYAADLGIVNGFTQELDSATEEYIPKFKT